MFRIRVRIRVRIKVSFLSRPIHCKHLSLIESTTSSVTSPSIACCFFYEQTFASSANNSLAYKFTDEATPANVLLEEVVSHSFDFSFALPTTEYFLKEFSNLCKIKATISKCDKSIYYVAQRRVVQKAISANPGLKFNRLFISVCSA